MKPQSKKMHNRFHKIANHIIQKQSPSKQDKPLTDRDDDEMGIEEEADAVDQEGKYGPKKRKAKDTDPNDNL
jgi:hypothetical protein